MERVHFGDINRFLVSTGLILISLAFIIPYFYLREDFGIVIEEKAIYAYGQNVQTFIRERQNIVMAIQRSLFCIAIVLSIIGTLFLAIGLVRWSKRQAKLDEKENLEVEKLRLEIENLSPEEKIEKAEDEVIANQVAEAAEETRKKIEQTPAKKEQAVSKYLEVEEKVVSHFRKYRSSNFIVRDNVKLANRYWVDILLESKSESYADRIVEIKYLNSPSQTIIGESLQKFNNVVEFYFRSFARKVVPVLVVVLADNVSVDLLDNAALHEQLQSYKIRYRSLSRLIVKVIHENDIDKFDIKELLRR